MPMVAIAYGTLMVLLGLSGFVAGGRAEPLALIPLVFGLPVLVLGVIGRGAQFRAHTLPAAALFAIWGILATLPEGGAASEWASGLNVAASNSTLDVQTGMRLLSLGYLVFAGVVAAAGPIIRRRRGTLGNHDLAGLGAIADRRQD